MPTAKCPCVSMNWRAYDTGYRRGKNKIHESMDVLKRVNEEAKQVGRSVVSHPARTLYFSGENKENEPSAYYHCVSLSLLLFLNIIFY